MNDTVDPFDRYERKIIEAALKVLNRVYKDRWHFDIDDSEGFNKYYIADEDTAAELRHQKRLESHQRKYKLAVKEIELDE